MFNRNKHDDHHADERGRHADPDRVTQTPVEAQRERFGGTSLAAAFFGWLCAIGVVILLSSIVGAVASAIGTSQDVTQSSAERQAGTIGIVAGAILLAILFIGYYCGGYVAGRLARFNGVKQGRSVWLLGLVVTIVVAILGAVFGSQYNILNRVNVPEIPIPTEDLSIGGAIAIVAAILVTLLGAILGGKAGTHFHRKVDRVA